MHVFMTSVLVAEEGKASRAQKRILVSASSPVVVASLLRTQSAERLEEIITREEEFLRPEARAGYFSAMCARARAS